MGKWSRGLYRYFGSGNVSGRNIAQQEKGGVENNVLDVGAVPGVGDMYQIFGGLDYGGVGVFAWIGFQREGSLPVFAVLGYGDIERRSGGCGVIVYEQLAAIVERDGIRAGIGVGQAGRIRGAPRSAFVR